MSDPFLIDGPAVISFSGGRTSAYMLHRILLAHGGGLPADVHVLFANTGKEREETLEFVSACATHWHIPIHWLEYLAGEVTAPTAARLGEPFAALLTKRKFLPNPVMRFCTQELKIRPMRDWMRLKGYEHWTNVVGIRADEPRRVAKMRAAAETRTEYWDIDLPLADAGITLGEVTAFWQQQPFDLQLQPHEGNCDLCFLKGAKKLRNIVRERPDLAVWWAESEERLGATFRRDRPSYRQMLQQSDLFKDGLDDDIIECACTD